MQANQDPISQLSYTAHNSDKMTSGMLNNIQNKNINMAYDSGGVHGPSGVHIKGNPRSHVNSMFTVIADSSKSTAGILATETYNMGMLENYNTIVPAHVQLWWHLTLAQNYSFDHIYNNLNLNINININTKAVSHIRIRTPKAEGGGNETPAKDRKSTLCLVKYNTNISRYIDISRPHFIVVTLFN